MSADELKKPLRSRFQRHANILIWKCYLQRQRRWRLLLAEAVFASLLFLIAVFIAKPVFLTPLQAEPEPPLAAADILASLSSRNILGYAPNVPPYVDIMKRAAQLLQTSILSALTEDDLNNVLYNRSRATPMDNSVIWVIFKPKLENSWRLSIRSTERARYETSTEVATGSNPHLRAGFLAVQLAISQAIVEYSATTPPKYEFNLVSMPVSPLMQEPQVRKTISEILLCFTLAFIPPVLETEALVVKETLNRFKRALRMRHVDYPSMYIGWIVFAFLTAMPICLLAAVTLIFIFRWIHLLFALLIVLAYVSVMIMLALIMAMFHNKAWIACVWSTLFTLLQMFLAELLVYHEVDTQHSVLSFLLHVVLPPLGLVHAFNQFALLQTGRGGATVTESHSLLYTIMSWSLLIMLYFALLMILQRTIGQERAIGGQVSWRSIIFKKVEDVNQLRYIQTPTGGEREKLQEVDELVAKAISFRNVSKSIMGASVLNNITLDIYRGEFTMLFADRVQEKMVITIEDLLTGLSHADKGTINVLGKYMKQGRNLMTEPHMMGYCHHSKFLVDDLTVREHFTLFTDLCLWHESKQFLAEYGHVRAIHLLAECDLESVTNLHVRNLDEYYRAQLCWAIALLLEPKVIVLPSLSDQPSYVAVIKDKIMRYKKYITIVKLCYSNIHLEYADRVFLFDSKVLVFGGTPAYMFFKYGREYRVRMTLRSDGTYDEESTTELLQKAAEAGATVRAHLGSLLILRLPASPTDKVAALVKDLLNNSKKYGMTSLSISLPDSEEVCRRAIDESRSLSSFESPLAYQLAKDALRRIADPLPWKRKHTAFSNWTLLRNIGWKYFSFYIHYRLFLIITILSTLVTGIFIGLSMSTMLTQMDRDQDTKKMLHGELLTMENVVHMTTLVLRTDNSTDARSVSNAYVLSEPNATVYDIKKLVYTALSHTESLIEYLVTRAIDSPQQYVYMYAYGMDVSTDENGSLNVQALYSPMHFDYGAAARSLARVHMALLRHYTGHFDATIQITDDPLALDLTPWLRYAATPPLLIQFLLILTISHITLVPSMEYGLIRHLQSHAMNFSPARYWFTLYFCDLILYWMLITLMSIVMITIMFLVVPVVHFQYGDLLVVPFMLVIYGLGCVPQAYLFSLGSRAALNSMTFIIVNMIFGETTILAKIFYGEALNYALQFMILSPQFNMAYAFVKIKKIFLYNTECSLIKTKNLCSSKTLHKCCQKCGVLQECYSRRLYLTERHGILMEIIATMSAAIVFMALLLLLEYKGMRRLWTYFVSKIQTVNPDDELVMPGMQREKKDVLDKRNQLKVKRNKKVDTFGEYLLACNASRKKMGMYMVRNVYLGLGKGEAIALSGLKRHGRLHLCEMLAGYRTPSSGHIWCMSKWSLESEPHRYARQIAISCALEPLPPWMTVYDGLELIASLRGVPKKSVKEELMNYIDALELHDQAYKVICHVKANDRIRLHFAAAVIGAPPIIILDECTAYQKFSVRRAMYSILYHLRKRGHAILISSSSVESHMPVTNRLAIIVDGRIYDIDAVDSLVERYSNKGYTVVVHLKDEADVTKMFARHFKKFVINDTSEVLVNVQVLDTDLNWASIFDKMESLKARNEQVYTYIVSAIPIDYIYNTIINNEKGHKTAGDIFSWEVLKSIFSSKPKMSPKKETLDSLQPFEKKYDITQLKELPWSVIFQR